jgi:hypothetical protein
MDMPMPNLVERITIDSSRTSSPPPRLRESNSVEGLFDSRCMPAVPEEILVEGSDDSSRKPSPPPKLRESNSVECLFDSRLMPAVHEEILLEGSDDEVQFICKIQKNPN